MAKVLEGIDLRGLIDLEAVFGTVLGGPAGLTRSLFPRTVHPAATKRKTGLARKRTTKTPAKRVVKFRLSTESCIIQ